MTAVHKILSKVTSNIFQSFPQHTSYSGRFENISTSGVLPKHCPREHESPVFGLVVEGNHLAPDQPVRQGVEVGAQESGAFGVDPGKISPVEAKKLGFVGPI